MSALPPPRSESGHNSNIAESTRMTHSERVPKIRNAIYSAESTVVQGSLRATSLAFSTPASQP
jgi:hypothetical protein